VGSVPRIRIRKSNDAPVRYDGDYVLYWMIAYRRATWNFSLQRAVEWALDLNKPLVIMEALRCGYRWASDRLHRFALEGMADNARQFKKYGVLYYPYAEPLRDAGKGLLKTLAEKACVIITDDSPAFFLPRMVKAASRRLGVLVEGVDSNGLLPMRAAERVFPTAHGFRRFLQKKLPSHMLEAPKAEPLSERKLMRVDTTIPPAILKRWPMASLRLLQGDSSALDSLPINHGVGGAGKRGGSITAQRVLKGFLKDGLPRYLEDRNQPEDEGTSGLSPYLHFGHISAHQVFHELMEKERWSFDRLSPRATGSRSGWWGVSKASEAFLDQLITWRELGINMCWQRDDYDRYESLPRWALKTLTEHAGDRRQYIYTPDEFENARTHDLLWNAAQTQLVREGWIHNYLRMLWGKKILEWTASPRDALNVMVELNNKYALDGRDPNSYSGIFWVLGRYDRAWGPERPIFGKVRYMSSESTARKVRVKGYIKEYSLL
jgi:deoxyribodipyrimidine photo-lyase